MRWHVKTVSIIAGASIAALAFVLPAAAQGMKQGYGQRPVYTQQRVQKPMPLRSNKGGYLRGRDRADEVHRLNRAKKRR
jgi:hypothetical protein